jgi:hypothetical protein
MGWWRQDGREDDRRRHDDDEECGHEQATEVRLDCRYHAAHAVEDNKAMRGETSGLGPSRGALGQTRGAGAGVPAPVRAARLRTYSCTSDTTVAWLQVSGETDSCTLL